MSHSDHRLWLELNGPELHIYNRSQLYARLEKVFGLESQLGPGKGGKEEEEREEEPQQQQGQSRDMSFWQDWRDLIPVIKIELNMVRSFGIASAIFVLFHVCFCSVSIPSMKISLQLTSFKLYPLIFS